MFRESSPHTWKIVKLKSKIFSLWNLTFMNRVTKCYGLNQNYGDKIMRF